MHGYTYRIPGFPSYGDALSSVTFDSIRFESSRPDIEHALTQGGREVQRHSTS